jgi:hypothetical protein
MDLLSPADLQASFRGVQQIDDYLVVDFNVAQAEKELAIRVRLHVRKHLSVI